MSGPRKGQSHEEWCTERRAKYHARKTDPEYKAKLKQWQRAKWARDRARPNAAAWALAKKWKLTPEQLEALYSRAGRKCQLCGRAAKLCIDHCHTTGRIRGVLCINCNAGLAMVERVGSFERIQEYLKCPS